MSETVARKDEWVLVTGASYGIGEQAAVCAAKDGYNVVLVARDEEKMKQQKANYESQYKIKVSIVAMDLSPPDAAQKLYDEVTKNQKLQIEVLFNNVGVGAFGHFFSETDMQEEQQIMSLNVVSFVCITKLFGKDMVARKHGKILHVSSLAASIPSPKLAVYAGTKAFIELWSTSLHNELKDTGVTLTILYPGNTDTEFFQRCGAGNTKMQNDESQMDPADVASDGWQAMMAGKEKVTSGTKNVIQQVASYVLPDSLFAGAMRDKTKEKEELGKTTKD